MCATFPTHPIVIIIFGEVPQYAVLSNLPPLPPSYALQLIQFAGGETIKGRDI
jgi:hypothetical protein